MKFRNFYYFEKEFEFSLWPWGVRYRFYVECTYVRMNFEVHLQHSTSAKKLQIQFEVWSEGGFGSLVNCSATLQLLSSTFQQNSQLSGHYFKSFPSLSSALYFKRFFMVSPALTECWCWKWSNKSIIHGIFGRRSFSVTSLSPPLNDHETWGRTVPPRVRWILTTTKPSGAVLSPLIQINNNLKNMQLRQSWPAKLHNFCQKMKTLYDGQRYEFVLNRTTMVM